MRATIIYALITLPVGSELPSNNYGKSPFIISCNRSVPRERRPFPARSGASARFFWASIENPRAYGALTMIKILLIGAISLTAPSQ